MRPKRSPETDTGSAIARLIETIDRQHAQLEALAAGLSALSARQDALHGAVVPLLEQWPHLEDELRGSNTKTFVFMHLYPGNLCKANLRVNKMRN